MRRRAGEVHDGQIDSRTLFACAARGDRRVHLIFDRSYEEPGAIEYTDAVPRLHRELVFRRDVHQLPTGAIQLQHVLAHDAKATVLPAAPPHAHCSLS